MRVNNRNSIARIIKFPRFTTMNVIDGQAGLIICASLFFYSLTIDNILNIIVLLILATVTISALTGDNGIITRAVESKKQIEYQNAFEEVKIAVMTTRMDYELKNKLLSISEECASDIETELKKNSPEGTVYLEDYSMYAKNRGYVFEVTEEFGINEIMIEGDTSLWVQEDGVIIAYNGDISELDGGTLVIPNYVGGVKITELKSELFYNKIQEPLQVNLKISNGIKKIGDGCFSNCNGLIGTLDIPNSVTYLDGAAFYGCTGFTGSLIIPSSVTYIGGGAFYGCTGFTGNLTIPSSVTYIVGGTFSGCTGFDGKLTIGKEDISSYFAASTLSNTKFTELELLDGVTSVGDGAFSSLTSLTLVRIPSSVSSMGSEAMAIGVSGVSKLIYVDGKSYRPDGWENDWVNYYYDPNVSNSDYEFPYAWYTYNAYKKVYDWHYDYNLYYYGERRNCLVLVL